MSSFNGLWTREGDGAFVAHDVDNEYFDLEQVQRASESGEALALSFQSTSDSFAFARCEGGEMRRDLSYDGSNGWTVEGDPEPWEADILLGAAQRASQRELFSDDAEQLGEVEAIFDAQRLRSDTMVPTIDVAGAAQQVLRHLGLPVAERKKR